MMLEAEVACLASTNWPMLPLSTGNILHGDVLPGEGKETLTKILNHSTVRVNHIVSNGYGQAKDDE